MSYDSNYNIEEALQRINNQFGTSCNTSQKSYKEDGDTISKFDNRGLNLKCDDSTC